MNISTESSAKLEALKCKLNSINAAFNHLQKQREEIEKEMIQQKLSCAFENGLFAEHTWKTESDFSGRVSLVSHNKKHKGLAELFQTDYHSCVDLMEGVELHFADWDIYFHFDNPTVAKDFIKKHNMKIDISGISKRLEMYRKEQKEAMDFIATIQEIQGSKE